MSVESPVRQQPGIDQPENPGRGAIMPVRAEIDVRKHQPTGGGGEERPAGGQKAGDASAGGAAREERPVPQDSPMKAEVKGLSFSYGSFKALKNINLPIGRNKVTALIGPSGCGKSTLLRCFNRMHDLYPNSKYEGEINVYPDRLNIIGPKVDPIEVRMRISMVFQKPNPFPKSIFENVAYGLRLRGERNKQVIQERVVTALKGAALWDESKDRLHEPAFALSGGQQQRLCIARALATDPEIILFDEPTSALDPIATSRIEELVNELRSKVTIIIVTHNMQQAARISDYTAFMYIGELVEFDTTKQMFTNPGKKLTEEYITGRFG
jgi:phosphate transport system ATP-binding protein